MPLPAFEDFVYGACLRDWDAESQRMHRLLARFDAAEEVRVVGDETDLRLSRPVARARSTTGASTCQEGVLLRSGRGLCRGDDLHRRSERLRRCAGLGCPVHVPEGPGRRGFGGAGRGRAARCARHRRRGTLRRRAGIGCNDRITRPMRNISRREDGGQRSTLGRRSPEGRRENKSSLHGTWSRTSGRAAGSSSTARPSRGHHLAASRRDWRDVPDVGRRVALATCAEIPDGDEEFPAPDRRARRPGRRCGCGRLWDDGRRLDVLRPRPAASTWDYAERCTSSRAGRLLPAVLNLLPLLERKIHKQRYLDRSRRRRRAGRPDHVRRPRRRARAARRYVRGQACGLGGWAGARRASTRRELDAVRGARRPYPYRGAHGDGPAVPRRRGRKGARLHRWSSTRTLFVAARRCPRRSTGTSSTSTRTSARRRRPPPKDVAGAALACAPRHLLYAPRRPDGGAVLELEIAEPSLYLAFGDGSLPERF